MNCIDRIFDEFIKVRSETEISIEQMKDDILKFDAIVLYGAGSAGIAFLKYLNDINVQPKYFADGKAEKCGEYCQGIEIISPEEIINRCGSNTLVIVTINTDGKRYCKSFEEALRIGGHTGVHRRLREAGCTNVVDYTYFRRCHKLFHGDPYNLPSCSDVENMLLNKEKVSMVYEWLEDDLSKETYEKIVKFRLIDDSIEVPTLSQENQYFEPGIYLPDDKAAFVDCGAFNGISMQTFLKINGNKFEHYYGFEPDKYNFQMLKHYVSGLPDELKNKADIYESAVYDKCGKDMLYSLDGPGSFMADIGNEEVETVTIDKVLNKNKATYIKMNIEGSELKALKGAENTVKEFKPMLAVAGYHKTWDLWEVPIIIKTFREDYKINLRSYMNHLSFVYYCV